MISRIHTKTSKVFLLLTSALAVFLLATLGIQVFKLYPNLELNEPIYGTYTSDEKQFLKTYYLMKSGNNFYEAFKIASEGRVAGTPLDNDSFKWRLPTVFYLWKALAVNGRQIFLLYLIWLAAFFIGIFFLLKKLEGIFVSLWAIILLTPYFLNLSDYKTSFLFVEWWALFPFIIGLAFFVYGKYKISWIFFLIAIITREHMIIPLLSFVAIAFLKKEYRLFFSSLVVAFLCFYGFHYIFIANQFQNYNLSSLVQFNSRFHLIHKNILMKMFAFSMQQYPLISLRVNLWLILASFVSLIGFLKSNNKPTAEYYLYTAPWSLLIAFMFIAGDYNDYWGILFMPLLIITVPFLFKRLYDIRRDILGFLHF